MNKNNITLSILAAKTDVLWINQMLNHICGAHREYVDKILVFVDSAPLGPVFLKRPGIGNLNQLIEILRKIKSEGLIDDIIEINYNKKVRKQIYKKYFGYDLGVTHSFRGCPVYGSIYAIENTETDYVLHFDSDMLFHCSHNKNWLKEAINLLLNNPDIMFVAPHPGPPRQDGELQQHGLKYSKKDTYFRFDDFSSRIYFLSKKKLEKILPIIPQYISWKRKLFQFLTGKSALRPWEINITYQIKAKKYIRADLRNPEAWTIHTPDHGPDFVKNLPAIIQKVEAGWFPESQAGDYDLILKDWL